MLGTLGSPPHRRCSSLSANLFDEDISNSSDVAPPVIAGHLASPLHRTRYNGERVAAEPIEANCCVACDVYGLAIAHGLARAFDDT